MTVRRVAGPGGITTTMMDGEGRVKVTRTSRDGTVLKEDEWSSARLVIETRLSPQLGDEIPAKATPESAAQAARKVHGKYVTYYALDKPLIPGPGMMGGLVRMPVIAALASRRTAPPGASDHRAASHSATAGRPRSRDIAHPGADAALTRSAPPSLHVPPA